jgi:hypothetical protein
MRFYNYAAALVALFTASPCSTMQVVLEDSKGSFYAWHIDPEVRFKDLISEIQTTYSVIEKEGVDMPGGISGAAELHFSISDYGAVVQTAAKPMKSDRDYHAPVDPNIKKDIYDIVKTLGTKGHLSIMGQQDSLNKAGDRIRKVHPLVFLTCVFTVDELIVAIREMEGKWIVWPKFLDGIVDSLVTEHRAENLEQFIPQFAKTVNINPKLLEPSLKKRNWEEFIVTLIHNVPRLGEDHKRYGKY